MAPAAEASKFSVEGLWEPNEAMPVAPFGVHQVTQRHSHLTSFHDCH